jgi:hypothetical protein
VCAQFHMIHVMISLMNPQHMLNNLIQKIQTNRKPVGTKTLNGITVHLRKAQVRPKLNESLLLLPATPCYN